ncbi:unnamed protein product, partial [Enterobius vermicularis]|uniref:Protein kinase domain-containing protein n=1 Tax=Enterobius vermicularis TaxID=51028 RepID=A0A0N4VB87_ENTVE
IGPETLLLATRGAEFNARLRDYRRYLWGEGAPLVTQGILGYRNQDISVRERRRHLPQGGAIHRMQTDISKLTPLAKKQTGVTENTKTAVMECEVVGKGKLEIIWSHFEAVLTEDPKYKMYFDGKSCRLTICDVSYAELGDYTCTAINEYGSDKTCARLTSGDVPGRAGQPVVELSSDTEVFIMWEPPMNMTGTELFMYRLELRPAGIRCENDHFSEWRLVADDIEEDAAIIKHLTPLGVYQFRVTVRNVYGYGIPSLPSRIIQTHPKGVPKLQTDEIKARVPLRIISKPAKHLFPQQALKEITEEEEEEEAGTIEGALETQNSLPLILNTSEDPEERFKIVGELIKGRFSKLLLAIDSRSGTQKECVSKIIEHNTEAVDPLHEFTALKECQHENVVHLIAAYQKDNCIYTFMEKLYEDIFQRFIFYDYYNEEQVACSVAQIVSALHWIHYKGLLSSPHLRIYKTIFCIAHFDIQPSNIMFVSRRSWHLKIVDFGCAQIAGSEAKYATPPNVYWAAPEMHDPKQPVDIQSDVWGLGIITFCLLGGFHPFADETDTEEEVKNNVLKDKCNPNMIFVQATQESLRFVTWALKKNPLRRIRTEEALQHRWLSNDKSLSRRRETIRYPSSRLRKTAVFTAEYPKNSLRPRPASRFEIPTIMPTLVP